MVLQTNKQTNQNKQTSTLLSEHSFSIRPRPISSMKAQEISRPSVTRPTPLSLPQRLAIALHRATRRRDGANERAGSMIKARADSVTVACISETHNCPLPPGDILPHAGDLSRFGTFAEIQAQISWLAAQPFLHKVVIAGNHDPLLDRDFVTAYPGRQLNCVPGQRRNDLARGGRAPSELFIAGSFSSKRRTDRFACSAARGHPVLEMGFSICRWGLSRFKGRSITGRHGHHADAWTAPRSLG